MGLDAEGARVPDFTQAAVILLDTNAIIWLEQGHSRTRALSRQRQSLYISPASLLELQFLVEAGRLRLRGGGLSALSQDPRWLVDDVPAIDWFEEALDISWTRDPFDRLIVAHARTRGWRLATGDTDVLKQLSAREQLAL